MFEAQLVSASVLKKIIDALKDLVTDVNLEISNEGIALQAMDASHVALVSLMLRSENFLHFNCERGQSIGISMSNLSKIIRCAENDDSVILRLAEEGSQLHIIFEGKKDDKISEFNLNLLSLDSEHLTIPDQDYPVLVQVPTSELTNICRELSQISDTINFDVNKERVVFSVNGDIGRGAITLRHKDSGAGAQIKCTSSVNVSFAIRYLNLFNKAGALGNKASLALSEELPLKMSIDFEIGEIKYYLAPKVND